MHPLNLNGKEALVIDVPEWAHDFTMGVKGDNGFEYLNCMGDRIWDEKNIELPEGEWVKLGTITNGVPDFDVSSYIESLNTYSSPTQSFISMLHSQNIDTKGKQVVVVKSLQ